MRYPTIPVRRVRMKSLDRFRGLNREPRPGDGEFTYMENLASLGYPLITPRPRRGVYAKPASPQGLIARDTLGYVDGADFVLGEQRIAMGLSVDPADCPKTLQSMGAYVIILPDKKYVNTQSPEDFGPIEAVFSGTGAEFSLCREDGEALADVSVGADAPETVNGALWLDTAGEAARLWQYSEAQGQWAEASSFVKLEAPGIGSGFFPGDTVRITGGTPLDGLRNVVLAEGDSLVLEGAAAPGTLEGALEVARRMPLMDHITECDNRLWGCRYGPDRDGNFVNEIYASRLGDFRNWESFQGLSTDSYAASFGEAGPFTGAASHLGYPLFFREEYIHKVFGSEPSAFRIQTTPCQGVQEGSSRSIALVGSLLLYKGREGVYAYDGSMPVDISRALGREPRFEAAAGAVGDRYYISMRDDAGTWELLVWDNGLGLWHREDSLHCSHFCQLDGELYAIDAGSRNILGILGAGEQEAEVAWTAQLGEFGLEEPEQKHICRIILRLSLGEGSRLRCLARYDGEEDWHTLCVVFGTELRSLRLPLRPRRCDHMTLRLQGTGPVKIYSITKVYEKGSDCS